MEKFYQGNTRVYTGNSGTRESRTRESIKYN